jgi:hypothetical protein
MLVHFNRTRGQKDFVCLKDASTIGILADVRTPGSLPVIVQFSRSIHKPDRRCHVLLLVVDKRKELNPFDYEKHFPGMPVELICQDELNFFKVPRKELTHPFTVNHFDIVFYLETGENFSLESVLYHSNAKMFAGATGLCNGVFDFEIELSDRPELPFLAENLIKYLQNVPVKQEVGTTEPDKLILF